MSEDAPKIPEVCGLARVTEVTICGALFAKILGLITFKLVAYGARVKIPAGSRPSCQLVHSTSLEQPHQLDYLACSYHHFCAKRLRKELSKQRWFLGTHLMDDGRRTKTIFLHT